MRIDGLPLFPLNVVLFPGMVLPLHIFEERYKQMIRRCLSDDPRFGVVLISSGQEVGGGADVYQMGAIARIVSVSRYDDGKLDLVTVGVERFRIVRTTENFSYMCGDVETVHDEPEDADQLSSKALSVYRLLNEYRQSIRQEDEEPPQLPADAESLSYVAGVLDIPNRIKQELLESLSTSERLSRIEDHLRQEIRLLNLLGPTRTVRHPWGISLN